MYLYCAVSNECIISCNVVTVVIKTTASQAFIASISSNTAVDHKSRKQNRILWPDTTGCFLSISPTIAEISGWTLGKETNHHQHHLNLCPDPQRLSLLWRGRGSWRTEWRCWMSWRRRRRWSLTAMPSSEVSPTPPAPTASAIWLDSLSTPAGPVPRMARWQASVLAAAISVTRSVMGSLYNFAFRDNCRPIIVFNFLRGGGIWYL